VQNTYQYTIVGGGVAGLIAANKLSDNSISVAIIDKGRGALVVGWQSAASRHQITLKARSIIF
jgi:predicted NAD/FAD-dependent oxidoreductase